ncbi:MAG: class I SAM-dependent methyltransferase [Prochloraceae cyanobacterium]
MSQTKRSDYPQNEQIKKHYEKSAKSYNKSWQHSSDFVRALSKKSLECLELKSLDKFVDICCGTGLFTKEICDLAGLVNPVLCVDTSAEMLEKLPNSPLLKPILMDANDFIAIPEKYDKILIKHAIHMINNRELFLKKLFSRLNDRGIFLLIIMSPQMEYPLFEAAYERFNRSPPNPEKIAQLVQTPGFKTKIEPFTYPITIEKNKYFQMLKDRFLSFLYSFTDREIQIGIEELKQKYENEEIISLQEKYVFIIAKK